MESAREQPAIPVADALPGKSARVSRLAVLLAFAAIYLIWGSTYLAIKVAIETIPPFLMAGARFTIAGLLLYVFARGRGDAAPTAANWRQAAIIGSLLFLAGNGALTWAELRVPSGLAALVLSIIPLWMVLLHHLELHRGLGWQLILGLVLGLAGIALLVGPRELLGGGRVSPGGAGILVAGSIAWAIGSVHSRQAKIPKSSLLAASMEMIAGGAGLLVLGLATGEGPALLHSHVSAHSWLGLAYLIAFGSLLGFTAYQWLLTVSTPSRVATYAYVNPVIAVLLGWALGGESLTPRIFAATVIIISAVAIIIARQARSDKDPQELPASGECPETVV
ncbi:MAG TPA: EamA family transporter [Terriglobia bacterium]|nr:EamA family transporter [Terriglobia bacterium]